MKNIIKNIFGFALVIGFSVASIAFAERTTPSFFNLTPTNVLVPADSSYVIGDASNKVQNGYFANLTVDTCTGCGAGGSQTPWTSAIDGGGFALTNGGAITGTTFSATSTASSTFVGGIESWKQISAPYFHATSTTGISTFNNRILVGQTALSATAANAKAVFSQGQTLAIGSGYSSNIGVYSEAISNGSTLGVAVFGVASTTIPTDSATSYGGYFLAQASKTAAANIALRGTASNGTYQNVGVYGVSTAMNGQSFTAIGTQGLATTNGNGSAVALYGTAAVTATADTGSAYGGYFSSTNTHSGGINYGLYTTASGGSSNYSFYGGAGTLHNVGMITSGTGVQSPYLQGSGAGMTLYPNNTTQANALIVYGNDGASSFVERMRMLNTGNLGIGTTSPWAKLSIVGGTSLPQFAIATTTNAIPIFFVNATSTPFLGNSGALIAIGGKGIMGGTELPDSLNVNGSINQASWHRNEWVSWANSSADVTADSGGVAGSMYWVFSEDNTGRFLKFAQAADTTGSPYSSIRIDGATANDGVGLFFGAGIAAYKWIGFATNTPIFETQAAINGTNGAATGTNYYIGFTNINPIGTTFEVEPTSGCYFQATTTQMNWQAVCANTSSYTIVDTGFASSTTVVGENKPYYFRVQSDGTQALFYMASSTQPLKLVAKISSNIPTSALIPGLHLGAVNAASATEALLRRIDFSITKLQFQINPMMSLFN